MTRIVLMRGARGRAVCQSAAPPAAAGRGPARRGSGLESGDYYSLNASGGTLWQLLLAGKSVDELPGAIAQRHGEKPAQDELGAFVARLLDYQLIVPADGQPDQGTEDEPDLAAAPWSTPEITVYADMKDLLAVDPPLPPFKTDRH